MGKVRVNGQLYDIDAILFDKDGTLLDFGSLWIGWSERLLQIISDKVEDECQTDFLAEKLGFSKGENTWDPKGPLAIGSMQDIVTILSAELYQQGIPWNQAFQLVNESYRELESAFPYKEHLKPIKGLREFLSQAEQKLIKMAVVTSDNLAKAEEHLEALGIDGYFSSVMGHDLVEYGKPFPDMAEVALKELSVPPERTLIIGDSNGDMLLGKYTKTLAGIGITPSIESSSHLKDADQIIENYTSEFITIE